MSLKFDISKTIKEARKFINKHVDGVEIQIPFLSFSVKPNDIEKKVARELLIRLADKRVLSAKECCDNCIDNALSSLQDVRKVLVDKQVDLAEYHDGGLYLLIELMAEVIRQFLTFEESLKANHRTEQPARHKEFHRAPDTREAYFETLNQIRFHLHSCLTQVAKIAEIETPKVRSYLKSEDAWMLSIYLKPEGLLDNHVA
jgi:ribosomal protein S4